VLISLGGESSRGAQLVSVRLPLIDQPGQALGGELGRRDRFLFPPRSLISEPGMGYRFEG
jgi:hypothetical protein